MTAKSLPSVLVALGARDASPAADADLLARFVSGRDQAAFADLVRRYARLVWRVARTRCRTDATAEDVFQAAFVVLSRKAAAIRTGGALAGWLHRTAHRLAVRAARKERPAVPLPADPPTSADPLDALTARELLAAVDDEMAKLSDAERSVLVLCGIDGLSHDEAARRLGTTTGGVKGRLERARAKLRLRLDARGLTLPAVLVGLVGGSPSAAAMRAAFAIPLGGAIPPGVEQLLAGGLSMKGMMKVAVVVLVVGAIIGGFSGRAPTPHAIAAPVPKEAANKRVVWSEPVRVDWKASGAERVNGVWTPDGMSVAVPAPLLSAKGEPLPGGGIDFRDAATGKISNTLQFLHGSDTAAFQPTHLAVTPDGQTLIAGGPVYEAGKKAEPSHGLFLWPGLKAKDRIELAITGPVSAVAVSPDGKQLTTISSDRSVVAHDTAAGKAAWSLKFGADTGHLAALAYCHPSDDAVWVAGDAGNVLGIKASTGKLLLTLSKAGMKVRAVASTTDTAKYAFGGEASENGQPLVVIGSGSDTATFKDAVPAKERINGLAFSPDTKHLAAACSDGLVRVFDVGNGKLLAAAKEHSAEVFSVVYSPDGKRLLTVGKDAYKVWDVEELMKAK
jgi:RNA polymerase sigma factor (sigma-70 family)